MPRMTSAPSMTALGTDIADKITSLADEVIE
jgi:hypothetical protein